MTFIVQKAFKAHTSRMRGLFSAISFGMIALAAVAPDAAFAREVEQPDSTTCTDPKHRHTVVRPLTEPAPIRKSDKVRVRRILM